MPPDPDLLKGVLADEKDAPVYPDDTCKLCLAEGREHAERCFHRHWETPEDDQEYETR